MNSGVENNPPAPFRGGGKICAAKAIPDVLEEVALNPRGCCLQRSCLLLGVVTADSRGVPERGAHSCQGKEMCKTDVAWCVRLAEHPLRCVRDDSER